MTKFPEPPPPSILTRIGADTHVLPAGSRVWRIYFQGGAHPTTWGQFRSWGPTEARFDHHLLPQRNQTRAILYGAVGEQAAGTTLAEVFQTRRLVERTRGLPIWVAFETTDDLELLDLCHTWPTRAGASMALSSGLKSRDRRWSQAIYHAFPHLDGLLYGSSMNGNQPCVALYERARRAMPVCPVFHRMLADPTVLSMLKKACDLVNYHLV